MSNATETTVKELKSYDQMTAEEKTAFDALSETQKQKHNINYQLQESKKALAALKETEKAEKEQKKADREKETAIKTIIADLKKGEITEEAIPARLDIIGVKDAEEIASLTDRIKKGATIRQQTITPTKPAFTLSHSFLHLKKSDFLTPTDGGRPDITLQNLVKKYSFIEPFLVRPVSIPVTPGDGIPEGTTIEKYYIINGKRRYWLIPDPVKGDNGEMTEELIPCVIVTGFPDETTEEKAEIVVNRGRSLNVLSTAQGLLKLQQRGIENRDLRIDLGFRTGEIEKLTSVFTKLNGEIQTLLKSGGLVESTAMEIAKLPASSQAEIYSDYLKRLKEDANARITETHVSEMRQKRAKEAIRRDTPELNGLTGQVADFEGTGAENAANGAENGTPAGSVDSKTDETVKSENQTPETSEAEKPAAKKAAKESAKTETPGATTWQENTLIALGEVRETMPSDAKVWDAFAGMVKAVEATTETEYAASPELTPEATIGKGKKSVENIAANRKEWAKKTLKDLGAVYNALTMDAPDSCFTAYEALEQAVKSSEI